MGRIKTQIVKRYAKLLLEKFPDKFTDDFESNKRVLMELAEIRSVKLRNQLAGYITRLMAKRIKEEETAGKVGAVVLEAPLAMAIEK